MDTSPTPPKDERKIIFRIQGSYNNYLVTYGRFGSILVLADGAKFPSLASLVSFLFFFINDDADGILCEDFFADTRAYERWTVEIQDHSSLKSLVEQGKITLISSNEIKLNVIDRNKSGVKMSYSLIFDEPLKRYLNGAITHGLEPAIADIYDTYFQSMLLK